MTTTTDSTERYDPKSDYPLIIDSIKLAELTDITHESLRWSLMDLSCKGLITTSIRYALEDDSDSYFYVMTATTATKALDLLELSTESLWDYWLAGNVL